MCIKSSWLAFALVATGSPVLLWAGCKDGNQAKCYLNGKEGVRECVSGRWASCFVEPDPVPTETGTVAPKYYIMSVIYAPPGTQRVSCGRRKLRDQARLNLQ